MYSFSILHPLSLVGHQNYIIISRKESIGRLASATAAVVTDCVLKRISEARLRGYVTDGLRRALEWHSRGQRFDPAYLHHKETEKTRFNES